MEMKDTIQALKKVETALASGQRPPVIAVIGDDDYLLHRLANRFYRSLLGACNVSSEQLSAEDCTPQKLATSLNTLSLFAASQTIWIKGFKPKQQGELAGILLSWLEAYEQRKSPRHPIVIVTWRGAAGAHKKLYEKIKGNGYVVEIPSMDSYSPGDPDKDPTYPWVVKLAQEQGKTLEVEAFQLLRQRVDPDLWSLKTEIDKLAVYCLDRSVITPQDVAAIVPESRTEIIFDLMDALVTRNGPQMLSIVQALLQTGTNLLVIIKMLHRQIRFMLQAHGLMKEPLLAAWTPQQRYYEYQQQYLPKLNAWSEQQGVDKKNWFFGLHPFLAFRLLNQVVGFSFQELTGLLINLKEVDSASKSGATAPEQMLEHVLISAIKTAKRRR